MNKTFTINLNGRVYHINDDAFDALNAYLDSLKRQFAQEEGAQEIMEDIEARIGELFDERMRYGMQVVRLSDVEDVIKVMGHPEEIASSEPEAEAPSKKTEEVSQATGSTEDAEQSAKASRRLYRNPDDCIIAGVCSGLGAYTKLSPWIFRALFLVLFFAGIGTPILVYVALWIIVPEATSVAQRLQMRGEPANVEAIRQAINDGEAVNPRPRSAVEQVLGFFLKFFTVAVGGCLGLGILLILFVMVLVHFMPYLLGGSMLMPGGMFGPMVSWNLSFDNSIFGILFAMLVVVALPIYVLVHYLIHRRRRIAPLSRTTLWALLAAWVVALASIMVMIF
jgi:phage shock protein PspC (stress-responsive transcriptional regulator)